MNQKINLIEELKIQKDNKYLNLVKENKDKLIKIFSSLENFSPNLSDFVLFLSETIKLDDTYEIAWVIEYVEWYGFSGSHFEFALYIKDKSIILEDKEDKRESMLLKQVYWWEILMIYQDVWIITEKGFFEVIDDIAYDKEWTLYKMLSACLEDIVRNIKRDNFDIFK